MAGIFSGYVNPIAIDAISWRYYIVYVILLAFDFAVVHFYLPETANMTLEEVAGIFDGENALISWKGVRRISKRERQESASRYMESAVRQVTAAQKKEDIELVENA